jgi:hypothetical protein
MNTDTKIIFDAELVELMVDVYTPVARDLFADLECSLMPDMPDDYPFCEYKDYKMSDMRDALGDCMADRIHDLERNPTTGKSPEWSEEYSNSIREAANRIAIHFCGKPEDDDE